MLAWLKQKISILWLKALITVSAFAAIVLRIAYPDLKVDSVTLGLLIVGVLPWLSELIESAKFPGGWEVKFRDVTEAGDKITASASPAASTQPQPQYSFIAVAAQDPNLALVGLRIELEQRLRQLAAQHGFPNSKQTLTRLLRELRQREALPGGVVSGLEELVYAGNQAAHGATVDPRIADWAITNGPDILASLDELL
jgi:hypothetical protein